MSIFKIQSWSERQQVVAVIMGAAFLISALYFFLLAPQNHRRRKIEREIASMQSELAKKNYLLGEDVLRKKKEAAEKYNRSLNAEWAAISERVAAFPEMESLPSEVGHIDFKVALFDVRQRLLRKSREMNISLPHDLGIDDAVHSNVDARTLMLQLRTVEELVDLALDLKISMLRTIVPLPPLRHTAGTSKEIFMEEYPVKIAFFGTRETLYDLFAATLEPTHVFTINRLRVESATKIKPGLLNVQAEISALVFLKNPEELKLAPSGGPIKTGPMGH